MNGKKQLYIVIMTVVCMLGLVAGESTILPGGEIALTAPVGWTRIPGPTLVLRGKHDDPTSAPRLAISIAEGEPATVASGLRNAMLRVADGCTLLDEDDIPLGGRIWHRLRLRFAVGPLAFGQTAWTGMVGGRCVVVVLSAPDEALGTHLATAADAIASLHPMR